MMKWRKDARNQGNWDNAILTCKMLKTSLNFKAITRGWVKS